MNLLLAGRYSNLMNGPRRIYSAQGLSFILPAAVIVLMLMITTACEIKISAEMKLPFRSLFPIVNTLQSGYFWCMLHLISTWGGLFYTMIGTKCTLASLISFVMMFALTSYLIFLCLKFKGYNRKTVGRYRRVSSGLWTRRRVY